MLHNYMMFLGAVSFVVITSGQHGHPEPDRLRGSARPAQNGPRDWVLKLESVTLLRNGPVEIHATLCNVSDRRLVIDRGSPSSRIRTALRIWHKDTAGVHRLRIKPRVYVDPPVEIAGVEPGETIDLAWRKPSPALFEETQLVLTPDLSSDPYEAALSSLTLGEEYVVDAWLALYVIQGDEERGVPERLTAFTVPSSNKLWVTCAGETSLAASRQEESTSTATTPEGADAEEP